MGILDELMKVPPSRGRKPAPLEMSILRPLNESDVEDMVIGKGVGLPTTPIAKLRHSHHMLARLLAEGRPNSEAALVTGYSPSRISILKNDPAFKELIEYYKGQVEQQYVNVHERLAALGLSTIDELAERLEANPDDFTARELMELAALTLDRAGHGPTAKTQVSGAVTITVQKFFEEPLPVIESLPTQAITDVTDE